MSLKAREANLNRSDCSASAITVPSAESSGKAQVASVSVVSVNCGASLREPVSPASRALSGTPPW